MNRPSVALVARADRSQRQVATYLRAGGYDVFECRDQAIARSFAGVVVIDGAGARERARAWLRLGVPPRIVVISSKPSSWKTLAMAHRDDVYVLAAPAFGWEIVDALRAPATARGTRSSRKRKRLSKQPSRRVELRTIEP